MFLFKVLHPQSCENVYENKSQSKWHCLVSKTRLNTLSGLKTAGPELDPNSYD